MKVVIIRYEEDENGNVVDEIVEDIIQCKDCKHYDGYSCHNKWYGDGFGWYAPPAKTDEGFCDWAERRER